MSPLRILITGEKGVGKTAVMNLLPGETILKIDDDLNELVQNSIELEGLGEAILMEINLESPGSPFCRAWYLYICTFFML